MDKSKIQFVIGDVGGFRFLNPVILQLQHNGLVVSCAFSERLSSYLKSNKTEPKIEHKILDTDFIREFVLQKKNPDIVFVSMSSDSNLEKLFILEAQNKKIPVLSSVDTWANFLDRYSDIEEGSIFNKLKYLPDRICVIDSKAKEFAVKQGLPEERLKITGSPHLESFKNRFEASQNSIEAKAYREKLGLTDTDLLLVFATEALDKYHPPGTEMFKGYTQKEVSEDFLSALARLDPSVQKRIFIVIKLHPFEDQFQAPVALKSFRHQIDRSVQPMVLMKAAQLVLGMTSMFLIESGLMQVPTISYQKGYAGKDLFIGNIQRWSDAAYSAEQLSDKIQNTLLRREECRTPDFYSITGAKQKIISEIEDLIKCKN